MGRMGARGGRRKMRRLPRQRRRGVHDRRAPGHRRGLYGPVASALLGAVERKGYSEIGRVPKPWGFGF